MKHQTNPSALPHSEASSREGIVTNTPPAKEGQGWSAPAANSTTPNPSFTGGALRDAQIPLLTKEGLGEVLSPGEPRLPYIAPAIEVIEVRTERGYAASADGYDFGNGGRW